ncbi:MAG: hypothetical protein V1833_04680 [Elusimicrobiota bacterium]
MFKKHRRAPFFCHCEVAKGDRGNLVLVGETFFEIVSPPLADRNDIATRSVDAVEESYGYT